MLGVFRALALLLAAVGIYGIMAYNVSQHTHESARAWRSVLVCDIRRLVLRQAGYHTLQALVLGAAGSLDVWRARSRACCL